MATITFTAHGKPATAGSKKAFPYRKKDGTLGATVTDSSGENGKAWRGVVVAAALDALGARTGLDLIRGPVAVRMQFVFSRPKSHFGTGRNADRLKDSAPQHHTKKPDVLKLGRAVEDALTGVVWRDDSQICDGDYCKRYGPTDYCNVTITEIEDE